MRLVPDEGYGRDIDADSLDASHRGEPRSPQAARGPAQPLAFGPRDAFERAYPGPNTSRPNLDDHDEGALASDDVELKSAQPQVAREYREALRKEQVGHSGLGPPSELGRRQGVAVTPCALPQLAIAAWQSDAGLVVQALATY